MRRREVRRRKGGFAHPSLRERAPLLLARSTPSLLATTSVRERSRYSSTWGGGGGGEGEGGGREEGGGGRGERRSSGSPRRS